MAPRTRPVEQQSPSDIVTSLRRHLSLSKPPKTLFHYTSAEGLKGILEEESVWATNIWYLNDLREFDLAVDLAKEAVSRRSDLGSGKFELGLFDALESSLNSLEEADVYVTSFSEHGDQLSQWRGYCPPGRGYSLGIEASVLRKMADETRNRTLAKCVYGQAAQQELVDSILENVCEYASANAVSMGHDRVFRESFKLLSALVSLLAPVLKHQGFAEEAEWRLISLSPIVDGGGPCFRAGSALLVPYITHDLRRQDGKLAVESLVVGPTSQQALACRSAKGLLERHRVRCNVSPSSIPYRPW